MEFTIENAALSTALKMSHALTGGLSHNNCIFSAVKDKIIISASNGTTCWTKHFVPAKVLKSGKFATKADVLANIKLSGKESTFKLSDAKLTIRSGRSKLVLATSDLQDINVEPPSNIDLTYSFGAKTFRELIDSMQYDSDVIETIEIKPISIKSDGNSLTFSTHDKFCMGHAQSPQKLKKFEAVVPSTILFGIAPFLMGDFECGISEESMRLKNESFDIVQKFVQPEEKLMDTDEVIKSIHDEKAKATFSFDKQALLSCLEEVASFSYENLVDTKLELQTNKIKKKINLKVTSTYGTMDSTVLGEIKTDVLFKASLYLFLELVKKTNENVEVKYYGNKLLIRDGSRNFIMPTLET